MTLGRFSVQHCDDLSLVGFPLTSSVTNCDTELVALNCLFRCRSLLKKKTSLCCDSSILGCGSSGGAQSSGCPQDALVQARECQRGSSSMQQCKGALGWCFMVPSHVLGQT